MNRITLFFGSFNPIHNGHLGLANYLIKNNLTEEVWFVVSPRNPLKDDRELIDEDLRITLVRMAIAHDNNFYACDIEFKMPRPSFTVDTLKKLQIEYPKYQFLLLIGCDNAIKFDKWKDYQIILQMVDVLVYPRENFDFQQVKERFPQMIYLKNAPVYPISSTQIREEIKENRYNLAKKWLSHKVYNIIKSKNIY